MEIKNVIAEMKKPMEQKRKSQNSPESGAKRLRYRKEERYKERIEVPHATNGSGKRRENIEGRRSSLTTE